MQNRNFLMYYGEVFLPFNTYLEVKSNNSGGTYHTLPTLRAFNTERDELVSSK